MTDLTAPATEASIYAASARSRSAGEVAAGRRPVRRLAAMGAYWVPPAKVRAVASTWDPHLDTTAFLFFHETNRGIEAILLDGLEDSQGRAQFRLPEDLGAVADLMAGKDAAAPLIVTPDTMMLRRVAALLTRGRLDLSNETSKASHQVGNRLSMISRLPISSRALPLAQALSMVFWAPSDDETYPAWLGAFGLSADLNSMRTLTRAALSGEANARQVSLMRSMCTAERAILDATKATRSASNASTAYSASNTLAAAFATYVTCDQIGLREASTRGDAPMASVRVERGASGVRMALSTPCRLKPGKDVRLFAADTGEEIGLATLAALDFDESVGLVGVFTNTPRRANDSTSGQSKGWGWLMKQASSRGNGDQAYVTAEPYLGGSGPTRNSPWIGSAAALAPIVRDVPLGVTLAGAGAQGQSQIHHTV